MKHDAARGEITEGDARYLLVRHDSLMGLFRRLSEADRIAALQAFSDSLAEHGGRSASRYAAADGERFLDKVASKAGELGWGTWSLKRTADGLELAVENSPFAQGYGESVTPVCAPIAGMLRAVAGLVLGVPVEAREGRCAAQGAARCEFTAGPR